MRALNLFFSPFFFCPSISFIRGFLSLFSLHALRSPLTLVFLFFGFVIYGISLLLENRITTYTSLCHHLRINWQLPIHPIPSHINSNPSSEKKTR